MGTEFIIGVLLGLLAASVLVNVTLWYFWADRGKVWKLRAQEAEDRARGADTRWQARLDQLLDRIGTSPRLEVLPPAAPTIDPEERHDFTDFDEDPTSIAAWNEYRGEPEDES